MGERVVDGAVISDQPAATDFSPGQTLRRINNRAVADAACVLRRITVTDIDELSGAIPDWDIELTQLRPGRFRADFTIIALGPLLIWCGRYNQQMLERVRTPTNRLTIARPDRGSDVVTVNGHALREDEVLLGGPDAEWETVSHGVRELVVVSINLDFLQSQAEWLGACAFQRAARMQLRIAGSEWTHGFSRAIRWLVDAVVSHGSAAARAEIQGSLIGALLARMNVSQLLQAPPTEDRGLRMARRIAVERARQYIDANLTEPIRLPDLCRHAHTQSRSLEYGFLEVTGVSPMAYVRALRLHRVRRLLRTPALRTRSVSEIALDCGFRHLSQFAADYKDVFAESPSVTYRRTQSEMLTGYR